MTSSCLPAWVLWNDIINIRSSDAIIIIGGGIGTLNEFTIACDEGRPAGIITNSGVGISNSIPYIVEELCFRTMPPNMVFDDDVSKLLDKLEVVIEQFRCLFTKTAV